MPLGGIESGFLSHAWACVDPSRWGQSFAPVPAGHMVGGAAQSPTAADGGDRHHRSVSIRKTIWHQGKDIYTLPIVS